MNAKEAKEIIEKGKTSARIMTAELEFAHGYLSAFKGPEVKSLIEALEDIKDHSGIPNFQGTKWSNYSHIVADEALQEFKEAVEMK